MNTNSYNAHAVHTFPKPNAFHCFCFWYLFQRLLYMQYSCSHYTSLLLLPAKNKCDVTCVENIYNKKCVLMQMMQLLICVF